jgi:hypothetical protein
MKSFRTYTVEEMTGYISLKLGTPTFIEPKVGLNCIKVT